MNNKNKKIGRQKDFLIKHIKSTKHFIETDIEWDQMVLLNPYY